jgi:antitoxin (DNA-binding transcriptional repressor) of toxin-antitoxin stability system
MPHARFAYQFCTSAIDETPRCDTVTLVKRQGSITIKQLHAKTGELVRGAGAARTGVYVTDRGKIVAVLAAPHLVPAKPRRRILLPEFESFLSDKASCDLLEDLDAIRGDR